jgi:hypothetical protein
MPGYFIYVAVAKKSLNSIGQYGLINVSVDRMRLFQKEMQICWVKIW